MASTVPLETAFWSKVERRAPDECWEWRGVKGNKGYGRFIHRGSRTQAHRVAFKLANGRDAQPFALHRCDNRLCVNPEHLWEGDNTANMLDMAAKGRWRNQYRRGDDWPPTHCVHGHERTPENTATWSGQQVCLMCSRERDRRRYQQVGE